MPQWEYQVIHLNVDPGKGGEPSKGQNVPPPFTQSYLEQEFPQHYSHPQPEAGAGSGSGGAPPAPLHPAKQLQNFLNGHGAQGWNLVGIFPLGPLLMMVMRRRSGSEPGIAPLPQETSLAKPPEPGRSKPQEPGLQELLQRLEALERRLPPTAAEPTASAASAAPGPSPAAPLAAALVEGSVLDAKALETLAAEPSLSGREAAEALGYRSTASLSNLGSRAGYPIGLVKLGVNGKVAVYRGVIPSTSGGRAQRQWVVVKLNRLER
jgi:hypothetical protein